MLEWKNKLENIIFIGRGLGSGDDVTGACWKWMESNMDTGEPTTCNTADHGREKKSPTDPPPSASNFVHDQLLEMRRVT
jgi:hypothetical protein